jgi:hypothetical protein
LKQKEAVQKQDVHSTNCAVHSSKVNDKVPAAPRSSQPCQKGVCQHAGTSEHAYGATLRAHGFTTGGAECTSEGTCGKVPDKSETASAIAPSAATVHKLMSCQAAESISAVLQDADWVTVVPKEQGKAWLQAAKTGDVVVLEQLLNSNVALLAYRGQGTHFGFGGVMSCSAK